MKAKRSGIDSGNDGVKIANSDGVFSFNSCIGEYRSRNLITNYRDEMEIEYNGNYYFMGELAEKESNFPRRSMGLTKANEDVLIRTLVAIHRFGSDRNKIVVGQPIKMHIPEEKQKIIDMLKKDHSLTLNGVKKHFTIEEVNVASEGASSWFGWFEQYPFFRIIDLGSGTVNVATIENYSFKDRESFTMRFGTKTADHIQLHELTRSIIAETTKFFNPSDVVLLVGGVADEIFSPIRSVYPNTVLANPYLKAGEIVEPKFANAIGFYNLAKGIYHE